jgi:cytochrome P450
MIATHNLHDILLLSCYAAAGFLLGGAGFVTFIIIYRLRFHPLAGYPGPFLAKITSWHDVYHAYKGDKHLNFYHLHQKYGTFVRYGPNTLSINDPAALKAIYGHKANVRKSDFYLSFRAAPDVFSTHTAIDHAAHARKRRVMSYAFSEAALKGVEDYVLVHVKEYLQRLAGMSSADNTRAAMGKTDEWTDGRDVSKWSSYLGFDVMGDLCFGKAFGMLGHNPENRDAVFLLAQAARRHNVTGPMPFLHQSGLDKYLFSKMYYDRKKYLAFSKKQVAERAASKVLDSDRKDFFYYLLRSKDPETGEGFSQSELWGESNTLIIAGSDTTSTTLTSTIFYLLHNPTALRRLNSEIRAAFATVEDIRAGPTLNGCKYLRACIDEALRMSPPVGAILPRTVLPGGLEILGSRLPAGTGVGVPIYAIHHHSEYVHDPFRYNPSRWLPEGQSPESAEKLQSVFNPFSIGSRGCIGKPMAYLELSLALGRLIWTYDMRLASGDAGKLGEGRPGMGMGREREDEFQLEDIFVSEKTGPMVEFRLRGALSA